MIVRLTLLFFLFIAKSFLVEAEITWKLPAVPISTLGQDAGNPQVAIDDLGNGVAVWARFNGSHYVVQAATYVQTKQAWTDPVNLSDPSQDADSPQVSINGSGRAVAVWSRFNGTHFVVQVSQTNAQSANPNTWITPVNLSDPAVDSLYPQVGVDRLGNIWTIWEKHLQPGFSLIEGRRFLFGTWLPMVIISDPHALSSQSAVSPKLSVDKLSGRAVAVWRKCNGKNGIIQASIFIPGNLWQIPVDLSEPGESASIPDVGIDDNGRAVAIWRRSNGENFIIQASTFSGQSWSVPVNLSEEGFDSDNPSLFVVQSSGFAFAAWSIQINALTSLIQASHSETSTPGVWSSPLNLSSTNNSYSPDSGVFGTQPAVVWSKWLCSNQALIRSNSGQTALFGPADPADETSVAVNGAGKALVVWRGFDGNHNQIWALAGSFSSNLGICVKPKSCPECGGLDVTITGTGLSDATAVHFGAIPATSFRVISDTKIEATAPPGNGMVNVFVTTPNEVSSPNECNEFTYTPIIPAQPRPPELICGEQKKDGFATQEDLINVITWSSSPTQAVTAYRVYRDRKLIATISADQNLVFRDHNRRKGKNYTYFITALIGENESEPIKITIPNRIRVKH